MGSLDRDLEKSRSKIQLLKNNFVAQSSNVSSNNKNKKNNNLSEKKNNQQKLNNFLDNITP